MKKVIWVKTDDPDNRKFNLVVTGPVEKVADIDPKTIYLNGNAGDKLQAVVKITPSEKYPFSIIGIEKISHNPRIQARLIDGSKDGNKSWQVEITSFSDKEDSFYRIVPLKTDSRYAPRLLIRVYAVFNANNRSGDKPVGAPGKQKIPLI
jgi:hypothetical protein